MGTQSNSESAGQGEALAREALKKTETVSLSAGYRASIKFVLVPRTSITFDPPGALARFGFEHPMNLLIELPIHGASTNLPPGDLKCGLDWLVSRGGQLYSYPVDGTVMMKVQPGGRFHVEVDGKVPAVDLIAQRLIGEGTLGFSVTPDFPHAETGVFTPSIGFNNPCEVKVKQPEKLLIGEQVTFTPEFAMVFNKADLELRVVELDEGESEIVATSPRSAFTHRWGGGLPFLNFSRSWAIGFTDDSCHQFADMGEEEAGCYEFAWQLWGTREGGQPTLLLEKKDFLLVPKPKLEEFRIEFDPSLEGTWEVSGRISGISPRAELLLDVAVVQPRATGPTPMDYHTATVRLHLEDDGGFEGYLGERHWFPTQLSAGALPADPAFAILSLPAAARDGKPGPIAAYLDFDDNTFSAFKGQGLSWDVDCDWVCSEEAVSMVQRAPRPKRRKSGISTIPAPPPEVGDPRTPLSFEDMWNDLTAWEGVVAYMYQDTEGHVTVGAGNLIPSAEKAKTLPFQNMDAGRAATPEEVTKAFTHVKAKPRAMTATEYALRPSIALSNEKIRELLKQRLEGEFLPHLRKCFDKFETYPRSARRALLDMVYNVGTGKFPAGFPHLTAAVKARNWSVAAEQCHVKSRHETRNDWRKALFQYAGTIDAKRS